MLTSFCPSVCGSGFSAVDGVVYAAQGDKVNAGISFGAAGIGLVSDAGLVKAAAMGVKEGVSAVKVIREASAVAKETKAVEGAGRKIAETIPQGITEIKNAEGTVFKEVHAAPSKPHAGISPHTHNNYRNVSPDGTVRTGVSRHADPVTRKDIIDATRPNAQRTGGGS